MKARLSLVALDTLALALGTWFLGWWAVPLIAALIGFRDRAEHGRAGQVALAAAIAWSALLVIDAATGPFGRLISTLGGVMGLPGVAVLMITLLFPATLGWSAATVAGAKPGGEKRFADVSHDRAAVSFLAIGTWLV